MTTKPILFSTPMVKAILDGRKGMTRRVVKPFPGEVLTTDPLFGELSSFKQLKHSHGKSGEYRSPKCKYQPGDILWVRETTYLYGQWRKNGLTKSNRQKYRFVWDKSRPAIYAADSKPNVICKGKDDIGYYKRPSIFMPREVARIFLRVTNVRCERLQEITDSDAINEGMDGHPRYDDNATILTFRRLWDCLNTKRGYGWDTNPWVWVISFERIEGVTQNDN